MTQNIKKTILGLIISTITLLILGSINQRKTMAQGFNLEVSPAKVNIQLTPGETYTQTFRVSNYSGAPKSFSIYTQDFTVADQTGKPLFLDQEDLKYPYSLSKWINLEETQIEVADEEVKEVEVKIEVPENAEAGGHYAAFIVQTGSPLEDTTEAESAGTGIGAVGRIAALILGNVSGDIVEDLDVVSFKTDKTIYYEHNPNITFTAEVQNKGNTHLVPTGAIFLEGGSNYTNNAVIFNNKLAAILPDTPARLIKEYTQLKSESAVPAFGKVNATLLLKYQNSTRDNSNSGNTPTTEDNRNEITVQTSFWLIPRNFVVGIVLGGLVMTFLIWRTLVSFLRK